MPLAVAREVPPTFLSSPEAVSSFGGEAVDLAASAGLVLDPWQVTALEYILGEDDRGRPAAFEASLIVPRQNGKGSVLEALSLAWLFLTDAPLILHSAHEFKTAAEAFRRLRTLIMGAPHLERRVERVTTAAGNEAIELTSGQRIRYVARSKGSGRGFTAGKILLDEAYALAAEEMAALLPTLATQPDAQLVYTSSAGMSTSDHLRSVRDRGRKGGDPGLCYLEWGGVARCLDGCRHSVDDPACGLNDEAVWAGANPSMDIAGHGIPRRHIANERRALSPDVFARERLGVWDEADANAAPIPADAWASCAHPGSMITGSSVVLAVDVSPGMASSSICVAGRTTDGAVQVELVRNGQGSGWVLDALTGLMGRNRVAGLAVDDKAAAGALLVELDDLCRRRNVPLTALTLSDAARACGGFQAAVVAGRVVHLDDPALNAAVASASKRDVGDGAWLLSRRRSDSDISPLVAAVEAAWLCSMTVDQAPSFASLADYLPTDEEGDAT